MIVTIPEIAAESAVLSLVRDQSVLDLMGPSSVVVSYPGRAFWTLSFPLQPLTMAEGRTWSAALAQLSDLGNRFEAGPPAYQGPSTGYSGSSPSVNGAGQLGLSLDCDGVSPSTLIARAGDYFEVNGELKILTADAESNLSGEVTLQFEPALRAAPADNAEVELQDPKSPHFALVTPRGQWTRIPLFYRIQIEAVERP